MALKGVGHSRLRRVKSGATKESTKHQAPTSKLQRNFNSQTPIDFQRFTPQDSLGQARSLGFGIYLVLGCWNLELSPALNRDQSFAGAASFNLLLRLCD